MARTNAYCKAIKESDAEIEPVIDNFEEYNSDQNIENTIESLDSQFNILVSKDVTQWYNALLFQAQIISRNVYANIWIIYY